MALSIIALGPMAPNIWYQATLAVYDATQKMDKCVCLVK